MTAKKIKYRNRDIIYFINKQINIVAKDLNFNVKDGTYVASHSYSTIIKQRDISIEVSKENLRHSSILITESYLDDYTDEVKIEYAKYLSDQ